MERFVIISCVNLGASHSANYAIYDVLKAGLATSASLMVPCPWSREAAQNKMLENVSVGIELTLNAECESYRWGPITQSPSLFDGNGGFPRTKEDLWEHADPEEVWRECKAQIERANLWGLKISHLGSHLDSLIPRPEYFDIYLELAKEFNIPIRLPSSDETDYGFSHKNIAKEANVLYTDQVLELTADTDISSLIKSFDESSIKESSIIEILCSPLIDTPEARAIHPNTYKDNIKVKKQLQELNKALNKEKKRLNLQLTSWSGPFGKN